MHYFSDKALVNATPTMPYFSSLSMTFWQYHVFLRSSGMDFMRSLYLKHLTNKTLKVKHIKPQYKGHISNALEHTWGHF